MNMIYKLAWSSDFSTICCRKTVTLRATQLLDSDTLTTTSTPRIDATTVTTKKKKTVSVEISSWHKHSCELSSEQPVPDGRDCPHMYRDTESESLSLFDSCAVSHVAEKPQPRTRFCLYFIQRPLCCCTNCVTDQSGFFFCAVSCCQLSTSLLKHRSVVWDISPLGTTRYKSLFVAQKSHSALLWKAVGLAWFLQSLRSHWSLDQGLSQISDFQIWTFLMFIFIVPVTSTIVIFIQKNFKLFIVGIKDCNWMVIIDPKMWLWLSNL